MMKRIVIILILAASAVLLHAESVWTGNAAVASPSFASGESGGFFAASNSFPSGTVLSVTNPKGGLSVDVTVIGRLETPGVFILLDRNAAGALNLPSDQVVPVRVSPRNRNPLPPLLEDGSNTIAEDIDYNPAAGLAIVEQPPAAASSPETPSAEPEKVVKDKPESPVKTKPEPSVSTDTVIPPVPVLIESYTLGDEEKNLAADTDTASTDTGGTDTRAADTPAADPLIAAPSTTDTAIADPPAAPLRPEPSDTVLAPPPTVSPDTSETDASLPIDSEKYIYFLTPSDLRPPQGDVDSPPVQETTAKTETADEHDSYRYRLPIVSPDPGSSYVQIGAYRNKAVLEDATIAVQKTHSGYPIGVALDETSGEAIYKLLIGPLRPAETGIVLQTARNTLFPDAFPYSR